MSWFRKFSASNNKPTECNTSTIVPWIYVDGKVILGKRSYLDIIEHLALDHEKASDILSNNWRGRYDSNHHEASITIKNAQKIQPPSNLINSLQEIFPDVEKIWSFPESRPLLGHFDDESLDRIYKSAWKYNFANEYFDNDSAGYPDLESQLRELFKTEYVIGELKRRAYLNNRLQFSRRYGHWLQKLEDHAFKLATQEVGPKILFHLNEWLKFHNGSGFAEIVSGIENDDFSGTGDITAEGDVVLGGGFQYNIIQDLIDTFLLLNPVFVQEYFLGNFDDEEYLQEYINQTGIDPFEYNEQQMLDSTKEQIEDIVYTYDYPFNELKNWFEKQGDFQESVLQVIKKYVYPAWRTWWGHSIDVAEDNVQDAHDHLEDALSTRKLNLILPAINMALNAQHIHGGMYEHMDLSKALLDELSNLDTEELDEFVNMVTGVEWRTAKVAQYTPQKVPKFYSDEFELVISDVDRYTADKYWIVVHLTESMHKYSIGLNMFNSHVGICGQGQYWHYDKSELSKAKQTFSQIKKTATQLHDEIEYVRPPMSIIPPMFRSALHYVDFPHRERSGVYSYNWFEELPKVADWRDSLYGSRYPHPPTSVQKMSDTWINTDDNSKEVVRKGNARQSQMHYKQASADDPLWLATYIGKNWRWTIPAAAAFLTWFASSGGNIDQLVQEVQSGATPNEVIYQIQPESSDIVDEVSSDETISNEIIPNQVFQPEVETTLDSDVDKANLPRGIRNNNPGNIERNNTAWEGLAGEQTDERFCTFESPEYGVRAMARILRNYQKRYNLNTIEQIINRWAPPSENDTSSYVHHVSQSLNVDPNATINLSDDVILSKLIQVIIRHENGGDYIDDNTIERGVVLEKSASSNYVHHYAYNITDKFEAKAKMYQIMRELQTTDWDTIVQSLLAQGVDKRLFGWLNQQWVGCMASSRWTHKYTTS